MENPETENLVSLRNYIAKAYNESELRNLVFELGLDYEELEGNNKSAKIISLLGMFQRRGQINALVQHLEKERPANLFGKTRHQYLSQLRDSLEKDEFNNLDHYIPLLSRLQKIKLREAHSIKERPYTLSPSEPITNPENLIVDPKQLVILGKPGSGKSTTLKWLALQEINRYEQTGRVPLLLDLSRWPRKELSEQTNQNFADYLQYAWLHDYGFTDEINSNEVILLLDGLNEMPDEDDKRPERINSLKQFIKEWDKAPIIVACRENEYTSKLDLELSLLTLEPLNPEQIEQYLEQKEVSDLWEQIKPETATSVTSLCELVNNPFLLTLYVATYIDRKKHRGATIARENLDKTQGQLIEEFVHYLWKRESNKAHHQHVPPLEELQYVLGELAFQMVDRKEGTSIDADFAREVIPTRFKRKPIHKELLLRLAESALLMEISRDGYSAIRFTHQFFQEYFASLAVQRKTASSPRFLGKLIAQNAEAYWEDANTHSSGRKPKKWDAVIRFLAELSQDPNQFIIEMAELDLFLAVELAQTGSRITQPTKDWLRNRCYDLLRQTNSQLALPGGLQSRQIKELWDRGYRGSSAQKLVRHLSASSQGFLAIDALTKLPHPDNLPYFVAYEQGTYTFGRYTPPIFDKGYQSIITKWGKQTLLQNLPKSAPRFPKETGNLVWAFIQHTENSEHIFNWYIPLQAFKYESKMDLNWGSRLYNNNLKRVLVSNIDGAIEILKECRAAKLKHYRTILALLAHPKVVQLLIEWINDPESDNDDREPSYIESLFMNPCTRNEDMIKVLELPNASIKMLEMLSDRWWSSQEYVPAIKRRSFPTHLRDIIQDTKFAKRVVDVIKNLIVSSKKPNYPEIGRMLCMLPDEIGLPVLTDVATELLESSSWRNYEILTYECNEYHRPAKHITLSEPTLKKLLQMIHSAIYVNSEPEQTRASYATDIFMWFKQYEAIPTLLEGASLGKDEYALAIGKIGLEQFEQKSEVISNLLSTFRYYRNYGPALALGLLKAKEAEEIVPEIIKTLKGELRQPHAKVTTNFIQALGEIGISSAEVINILRDVLLHELQEDSRDDLWFKLKKEASIALHKLQRDKVKPIFVNALKQPFLKGSRYYSYHFDLVNYLLDRVEDTKNKELVTDAIQSFLPVVQQLDKEWERMVWWKLYGRVIQVLTKWRDEETIPLFSSILNDPKADEYFWEQAIEQLALLGSEKAIHSLCAVLFVEEGDSVPHGIYSSTHDKLCGLVTEAVIQIGTEVAFTIFMAKLNNWFAGKTVIEDVESKLWSLEGIRAEKDHNFIGSELFPTVYSSQWYPGGERVNWWLEDVNGVLQKVTGRSEILRLYIKAWFRLDMANSLRNFLAANIPKNSETYIILTEEMELVERTHSGYQFALELLRQWPQDRKSIKKFNNQTARETNPVLPLIKLIDQQSDESKKKWFWS